MKRVLIIVGVLLLITIFTSVGVVKTVTAEPPKVETISLTKKEIKSQLIVPGVVSSNEEESVSYSPDKGVVREYFIKEGDKVKKGDKLFKYDDKQVNLEIQENQDAINLSYKRIDNLKENIKDLNKQKEELAKQKEELTKELNDNTFEPDSSGTETTLPTDSREQISEDSTEALDQQEDQLEMELDTANSELKQYLTQKETLDSKKQSLIVYSNVNGTVTKVNKTFNDANVEEVLHIVNFSNLKVTASVSEYDVLNTHTTQKVKLISDVLPDQEISGEVTEVSSVPNDGMSDEGADTNAPVDYPVTIKLLDKDIPFKPGFKVSAEIATEEKNTYVLPTSALQERDGETYVYIVDKNKIKSRNVEVGITSEENIEILQGIEKSEKVIKNPSEEMTDGMEVTEID